ncbi:DUF3955 domain-containing protein [Aeromonas salmonicida]|uniref:DUF3955 domain-containing protein n=1 Tax=Aeromonas salmonicida TaxID=645 RepID=UPI0034323449
MIGSTVDDAGVLHEPFGLLPIGFGLLSIGVLVVLFGWLRTCIRRRRARVGGIIRPNYCTRLRLKRHYVTWGCRLRRGRQKDTGLMPVSGDN